MICIFLMLEKSFLIFCPPRRNRTSNLVLKRDLLCQLSYGRKLLKFFKNSFPYPDFKRFSSFLASLREPTSLSYISFHGRYDFVDFVSPRLCDTNLNLGFSLIPT